MIFKHCDLLVLRKRGLDLNSFLTYENNLLTHLKIHSLYTRFARVNKDTYQKFLSTHQLRHRHTQSNLQRCFEHLQKNTRLTGGVIFTHPVRSTLHFEHSKFCKCICTFGTNHFIRTQVYRKVAFSLDFFSTKTTRSPLILFVYIKF